MNTKAITTLLTVIFLFLIEIGALCIAVYDTILNVPVPSIVVSLLTAGLTYGVAALGINHGANTTLQGIDKGVETQEKPSPT